MKNWLAENYVGAGNVDDRPQTDVAVEADGRHYSPSGLVMRMYEPVGKTGGRPRARGTSRGNRWQRTRNESSPRVK